MEPIVVKQEGNLWVASLAGAPQVRACAMDEHTAREKLEQELARIERTFDFYSSLIRPGDLCFDVGANLGERSMYFLKLGARVVAVEPQLKCIESLRQIQSKYNELTLVEKALGADEGETEIMLSDSNTISSMSPEWIETVKKSGRFVDMKWEGTQKVRVTTLDRLIEEHGVPAFVKIDVEGYELNVLKGLSSPVGALSFEFIAERMKDVVECMRHLLGIGPVEFNLSLGESMQFAVPRWFSFDEKDIVFSQLREDRLDWGDVYARFL